MQKTLVFMFFACNSAFSRTVFNLDIFMSKAAPSSSSVSQQAQPSTRAMAKTTPLLEHQPHCLTASPHLVLVCSKCWQRFLCTKDCAPACLKSVSSRLKFPQCSPSLAQRCMPCTCLTSYVTRLSNQPPHCTPVLLSCLSCSVDQPLLDSVPLPFDWNALSSRSWPILSGVILESFIRAYTPQRDFGLNACLPWLLVIAGLRTVYLHLLLHCCLSNSQEAAISHPKFLLLRNWESWTSIISLANDLHKTWILNWLQRHNTIHLRLSCRQYSHAVALTSSQSGNKETSFPSCSLPISDLLEFYPLLRW